LYFLEDLSLDEMAQTLGVPAGTVKSRLHYAKAAMRRILFTTEDTESTEKEEVRCKK
jgi:DNA-directed RNA polymerase specialized sigma24 family protein